MTYTSRSRSEKFQHCARAGYWNYLYNGRGIVPVGASVPLTTGIVVHEAVANIIQHWKAHDISISNDMLEDLGVFTALERYDALTKDRPYQKESGEGDYQEYVWNEQRALSEALVRLFCRIILPMWRERYEVVMVEKEMSARLKGDIILESRIDSILKEKSDGDIYIVSLKTAASLDDRLIESYNRDLQGLTETIMAEKHLKQKIMGVLMCVLLKGRRYQRVRGSGKWEQYSPLIKGWQRWDNTEFSYAHSYEYSNPSTPSGKSRLGKGWGPFDVWEKDFGVKGWIDMIMAGEIQPEEDILTRQVYCPAPFFRNSQELKSSLIQIMTQENQIAIANRGLDVSIANLGIREALDYRFVQTKKSCDWPSRCEYQDVCYTDAVMEDPIGSGLYEWRVPHHDREREEIEKR